MTNPELHAAYQDYWSERWAETLQALKDKTEPVVGADNDSLPPNEKEVLTLALAVSRIKMLEIERDEALEVMVKKAGEVQDLKAALTEINGLTDAYLRSNYPGNDYLDAIHLIARKALTGESL
jgi:hypothetical protein